MAARSVQFTNGNDVVEAYENQQIPKFAICADKQFLFKYVGDDVAEGSSFLTGLLEKLQTSAAIYTLKVYEDPEQGKVNEKTPCDGSFNFRFLDAPVYSTAGTPVMNGPGRSGTQAILDKLEEMHKRIEDLETDEAPKVGSMGMIGEILDLPIVQTAMPMIIEKIMAMFDNKQPSVPGANVTPMQGASIARVSGLNLQDRKRVDVALARLEKNTTDLPAIMEKLADMAEKKPLQFSSYLSMFMKL